MPWTPAQHRLFEAAAHSQQIAQSHGIPQAKAANMASEGIAKPRAKPQVLASVLRKMNKGNA